MAILGTSMDRGCASLDFLFCACHSANFYALLSGIEVEPFDFSVTFDQSVIQSVIHVIAQFAVLNVHPSVSRPLKGSSMPRFNTMTQRLSTSNFTLSSFIELFS